MSTRVPRFQRFGGGSPFGGGLTPLGKKLLVFYVAAYFLELLAFHWFGLAPLITRLVLYPPGPGFGPWQILTHLVLQDPSSQNVFGVAMVFLMFYFFAGGMEKAIGTKRFLFFFYLTGAGGAIIALPFLAFLGGTFMGMGASIAALVIAFGLMNPHSTILFNFFIPISGMTLVYVTVGIEAFRLVAGDSGGAVHLGACLIAYLYMKRKLDFLDPWMLKIRYDYWRLDRMKKKFTVLEGGKRKPNGDRGGNGGNGDNEGSGEADHDAAPMIH